MSLDDHRGAAFYIRSLMRESQAEIDRGERKGATVKFKGANWAKVKIGWFAGKVLRHRRRA